jgi:hypothetical protein
VSPEGQSRWRLVPAGAGALLWIVVILTTGAGVVLAPVGVGLTIVAFRRIRKRRPTLMWIGAVLNAYLAVFFFWSIGLIVYDAL